MRAAGTLALAATILTAVATAQQPIPPADGRQGGAPGARADAAGRGGIPPPIAWADPPLPDGPIMTETALPAHRNVRIHVIKGLQNPWSLAFLPDGGILITERPGRLRIVRNGALDPEPIAGLPAIAAQGLAGLQDIALHPRFAENRTIFFSYHKWVPLPAGVPNAPPPPPAGRGAPPNSTRVTALARATFDGRTLSDARDVFVSDVTAEASRIVFGRDGMIYMGLGNSTEGAIAPAQTPSNYGGKIIRVREDGSVPPDNPFIGRAGFKPEIYTLGHRNPLGMAVNPETGDVWAAEQGPNGGDEINIIRAGTNFGWPLVGHGRSYPGPRIAEKGIAGMEEPIVTWIPSIAVSGMTFYTGDRFPGWRRNVFVGGLRQGEAPRTGQLQRIEFNERWEEIRREPMLRELHQRIRDVRQGPDGYLYLLTEEAQGALLRLEPAS